MENVAPKIIVDHVLMYGRTYYDSTGKNNVHGITEDMVYTLCDINPYVKCFNQGIEIDQCLLLLVKKFSCQPCHHPASASHRSTKCTCMNHLRIPQRTNIAMNVAKYMVNWSSLSLATKREIIHEWIKVASYLVVYYKEANQTYMLPTLLSTDKK